MGVDLFVCELQEQALLILVITNRIILGRVSCLQVTREFNFANMPHLIDSIKSNFEISMALDMFDICWEVVLDSILLGLQLRNFGF